MSHPTPSTDSPEPPPEPPSAISLGRRSFLVRGLAATAAAAGGVLGGATAQAENVVMNGRVRATKVCATRQHVALLDKRTVIPSHPSNGDEDLYPNRAGNYSKGLPHDTYGEVDQNAYRGLLTALRTGKPDDFEAIKLGALSQSFQRKLVNPQAALASDLEGGDSHVFAIRPAPALNSLEAAGEMVENYWMALTRDVAFNDYDTDPLTLAAAADLSNLSDFRGPMLGDKVTTQTLFRDNLPGATVGPYLSQFMLMPVPFGANYVEQQMRTTMPGLDFMTSFPQWLSIQRGEKPTEALKFDSTRRYIRNGRDLSQWVHMDVLFQAYFHAMLIMLAAPDALDDDSSGLGVPFDPGNPYFASKNQEGFGTFGAPHIAALMCEVASRALKGAWFQKWSVHRRIRPEAFAGRVHNLLRGVRNYPIAVNELLRTQVLSALSDRYHGYLLPMAFPEGSPLHPSYAAGHATVAGACVTILKAWFPESYIIPNPVFASPDGLSLYPYSGPPLTIGGELNKLASNIATGRNIAGVHWRSDAFESLKLGEAMAISILADQRPTYNEKFDGFSLTKFDGTMITV